MGRSGTKAMQSAASPPSSLTGEGVRLPACPFHPCDGMVSTRALDTVVLLNLSTEEYLTLREVAARIWEMLDEGFMPAAMVDRLCDEYDVSREQVTKDLAAQLEAWLRQGLIEPGPVSQKFPPLPEVVTAGIAATPAVPAGATTVAIPSVFRCGLMIIALKTLLRTRRFAGTIGWIRRRVEGIPVGEPVPMKAVLDVAWAVAIAGSLYPGRAKCLEQSLVLYYILRRRGVAVDYCQGVHPFPFQAHAWIEYAGKPVSDVVEHTKRFARLPELLP